MSIKIFFHIYSHKIFFWLFVLCFLFQAWLWKHTESYHQQQQIVPEPISKYAAAAASFGDKEFLFRALSTRLQNSGDIFAGFIALKKYDYNRLYQWFKTLDTLNGQSTLIPSLASYYYSQTQNKQDTIYIINYLDEFANKDIDKYWWWLFQATFIAKRDLKNYDLSLKLANKMASSTSNNVPIWVKQMPAFISAEMGNNCLSLKIINTILQEYQQNLTPEKAKEINFMRFFIQKQINILKQQKFDINQCQ